MNSLPTHYHCWLMTPSFLNPKRNPMIPLEQKLLDLNLTVMSHHLETTLSEAAGKNLSAAATLEWLADMELEARRGRAIERRFKCSKLHRVQLGHLTGHAALAGAKLSDISAEIVAGFIEKQRRAKYEVSSINRALQVLRRAFHLALEWGKVEKLPVKISLVPGERRRERVLSEDEESAYLKAANEIGDSILGAHE